MHHNASYGIGGGVHGANYLPNYGYEAEVDKDGYKSELTQSEVMVLRYPYFIKSLGRGFSQVSVCVCVCVCVCERV